MRQRPRTGPTPSRVDDATAHERERVGHHPVGARIAADVGVGLPYDLDDPESVAALLHDTDRTTTARDAAWKVRHEHVFDSHLDHLESVFARGGAER